MNTQILEYNKTTEQITLNSYTDGFLGEKRYNHITQITNSFDATGCFRERGVRQTLFKEGLQCIYYLH